MKRIYFNLKRDLVLFKLLFIENGDCYRSGMNGVFISENVLCFFAFMTHYILCIKYISLD